jgi:transposase
MASEKNRLIKVLEDANIKLSSVVTKISGVSSLNMIRALLEKDRLSREEIADMTKGKLKKKVDLLSEAPNGNITDHHRFLLRMHLDNIEFHSKQIKRLDEEIQRRMIPFQEESWLIQTIPGIKRNLSERNLGRNRR